ncbi:hypothetical protein PTSG_13056 [Salpingoeca rosetta]|uniref:Uncharacterized protein n=1 Tax=Salpingoeca rosetta (strain ATCC 50818 / BSB-021) TaxID=946362 RepID=F2UPT5_SALR5|nr:uncharacterized protein PTSG_13056 [Salpingoeca rosetta]EGD79640.1 hypothetical protein PTSG_13056 [Salpingoeca rosetta]|eukprot:XP_004988868.1 hypothetical protein PTSG_13056 [Salpingoeca rosetta]
MSVLDMTEAEMDRVIARFETVWDVLVDGAKKAMATVKAAFDLVMNAFCLVGVAISEVKVLSRNVWRSMMWSHADYLKEAEKHVRLAQRGYDHACNLLRLFVADFKADESPEMTKMVKAARDARDKARQQLDAAKERCANLKSQATSS